MDTLKKGKFYAIKFRDKSQRGGDALFFEAICFLRVVKDSHGVDQELWRLEGYGKSGKWASKEKMASVVLERYYPIGPKARTRLEKIMKKEGFWKAREKSVSNWEAFKGIAHVKDGAITKRRAPPEVRMISVDLLDASPLQQPDRTLRGINDLTRDIVEVGGVREPIHVRPKKNGRFEIQSGHRRTEASRRAGLLTVPCIVQDEDTAELWDSTTTHVAHKPFEKLYAHLASGRTTKIPGTMKRQLELAEEIFGGEEGIKRVLYPRRLGVALVDTITRIHSELSIRYDRRLKLFKPPPSIQTIGLWFVEHEQSFQVRQRLEGRPTDRTADLLVLQNAILKNKPIVDRSIE